MTRWKHDLAIGLIGAAAYAFLAHVSSHASISAFENPNPNWFEMLWPLWVFVAAVIPGLLIGWAVETRPYILAVGAYLLGGCSFYISRHEISVQLSEYFPYHSLLLELLRENFSFSLIGAVAAFIGQRLRRRHQRTRCSVIGGVLKNRGWDRS